MKNNFSLSRQVWKPCFYKEFSSFLIFLKQHMGLPLWLSSKEYACCRSCRTETRVRSLVWEDPLEEDTATHSNILAWGIPWTQEPGGLQTLDLQKVGHDGSNLACRHASSMWGLPWWLSGKESSCQCRFNPWLDN